MIRPYRPGDEEYVISSHDEIYRKEYQFDSSFREFISATMQAFLDRFDPEKEQLWIVEVEGEPKGSIGITRQTDETAQLRWFLIEPEARGQRYGKQLLETAIQFCREKKYETISLVTNSKLDAARALYEKYGFSIVETTQQLRSNQLLIEERWEKRLALCEKPS